MSRIRFLCFCLALVVSNLWAQAQMPVYAIGVSGLSCPFCAYGIEKTLHRVDGVESVEVNLRDGVVLVTMAADAVLDEATARKAVKDAGFTLNSFSQIPAEPLP
ncbi:MAG: heavy-metal-associated domain-containing protein [Pseudomonadales bacterium]|nr:heavy-metal-associated domain-containing protein [Pseudomonadales bacterium]